MKQKKYKCLKNQIFTYKNLILRCISESYIEDIRKWRNKQTDILRQKKIISKLEQQNYFKKNIFNDMGRKPKNILFAIFYDEIFIGYGGLVHISWGDMRAEISFLLDPKISHAKKKYEIIFSNYLYLIKSIAFESLALNKIFTETFKFRTRHINILEKNKFVKEGELSQHNRINNNFINSVIHGCLNEK
jgi:RimJ/RimL family protein N-acetyltransferase